MISVPVGGEMTILNTVVATLTLLLALTVNSNVPAWVGIPLISPFDSSTNPGGRLPLCNNHVMGSVPVAVSVTLYTPFATPSGR